MNRGDVMLTRVISSLIGLPIFVFLALSGGIILKIGILIASLIGLYEFYNAFYKEKKSIIYVGYFFSLVYMIFLSQIINESNYFNIFVSLFIVIILVFIVVFHSKFNINDALITFFGFFYVSFLISHIYLVREFDNGIFFVWLIFISAWGCDTGAYFVGVTMGKHKLIPQLSPKKTVEGFFGGIITASLLAVIYGFFVKKYFNLDFDLVKISLLTCSLGSAFSQIGDLSASAIKRYTKIKDFGYLIPGHGGILDRFDSVLFTAPVVYYIVFFLYKIQ